MGPQRRGRGCATAGGETADVGPPRKDRECGTTEVGPRIWDHRGGENADVGSQRRDPLVGPQRFFLRMIYSDLITKDPLIVIARESRNQQKFSYGTDHSQYTSDSR